MSVASRGWPKCKDCGRRMPTWRSCEPCKAFARFLNLLHLGCDKDQPGKAERVERYAAIVRGGGRLFE
jgi:hypothetical protein